MIPRFPNARRLEWGSVLSALALGAMGAVLTLLFATGPQPVSDAFLRALAPESKSLEVVLVELTFSEAAQSQEAAIWAEARGASVASLLPLGDLPWPALEQAEDPGALGLARDWDGRFRRWDPEASFPAQVLATVGQEVYGPRQLGRAPPHAVLSLAQLEALPDEALTGKLVLLALARNASPLWTAEGAQSPGALVGGLLAGGHHPRLPGFLLALLGAVVAILGTRGSLLLVPLGLALCALSARFGLPLPTEAFLLTALLSAQVLREARRQTTRANLAQLTLAFESAPLGPPGTLTACAEQLCKGAVHIHGVLAAWVLAPSTEGWEEIARQGDGSALDPALCDRLLGGDTGHPEDSAYGALALRVEPETYAVLVYQVPDIPGFDPEHSLSVAVESCARRLALSDSGRTPPLARRLHALLDREAIFRASFRQAPVASVLYDTLGHCLEAPTDLPAVLEPLQLDWERLETTWIGLGGEASDLPLVAAGSCLRLGASAPFWAQLEAICAGGRLLALRLSVGEGPLSVGNGEELPNSPGHEGPESHKMYSPS